MSMFYELMMRKKEQIMYATIKGSLTESPEGVFSGFSSSNYLLGQTNITSEMQQQYLQSFEFQTKIKISTITQETQILYFPYRGILNGITLRSNGAIRWYVISSNYNIISTSLFSNGDTVYIKGKISNGIATLYSSIDGTNWITEGSVTLGTLEATDVNIPIRLGKSGTTSAVGFEGSIDLNNSYIKLGSTKYNLQAVVGYTIVGSPTITDGVVSGFSSSDYLTLPEYPNIENIDSFEFVWKWENITINAFRPFRFGLFSSNSYQIRTFSTGFLYFDTPIARYNTSPSGIYITDYPFFKLQTKNGLDKNVKFFASNDGKNWIELTITEQSAQLTDFTNDNFILGYGWTNAYKLYIKDCLIKINNKLWFNGQQA